MEDYKKLLTDLYLIYDPERVKQIDYFLEKYKGQEKQFYIRQKENYEKKKPVSDSKKIIEEALARIKAKSSGTGTTKDPEKEGKTEPLTPIKLPEDKKEFSVSDSVDEDSIHTRNALVEEDSEVPKSVYSSTSRSTNDDVWFSKTRTETIPEPITIEPETPIHVRKNYFLNIFGMVLLVIFLIVIVYITFFNEPDKQAVGVVKKPAGMTTPSTSKETTTLSEDKEETAAETKRPEKETPKSPIIEKEPPASKTNTSKTIEEQKKLFDKSINPLAKTADSANDKTIQEKPSPSKIKKRSFIPGTELIIKSETIAQKAPELETTPLPNEKPLNNINGVRINKGDLLLPVYFVACYAVKSEAYALTKVNQLKARGFDASYYWIPDFVPQGNKYFKVVIGPFATQREAMRKLTPVQERAEFDAYVLQLK